ncbi:hypothetical protein [Streptomyces sp. CA-106110]|uniref:hypothetical protein n=1 Tax=Streptomyces sp. CA-106110 TaxID=3240044 RepID=UPI003D8C563A
MRLSLARRTSVELRAWTRLTGSQMGHLVVVLAYRTNLTMQQLASLFATTDSPCTG